jgi:hypothetical protein
MKERKREKPPHDFRENVRVISQIQATRGRDAEHFIKVFRHEGDNVASATLGTLLGVFEIDDSSEDSKYIVNFLFSVAKNEYFCNPKRAAVESFEAALHKINVALAEIVKHGNIRWLGKLHGTIAILERNSMHLSAAGNGRIYLSRNGSFSHISEGLASPEAIERPIKTFIEISSGQLTPGDRILFLLPEAIDVIGEPTLAHHAGQMNQERFGQFLRTAMINKLDRGGAIIIDIEEAPPQPEPRTDIRKKTAEKEPSLQNYFSETAFEKQRKESIATALSEERSHQDISPDPEYTDTKTGHIYIQGDQKETPIEPSRIAQYSESLLYFSRKAGGEIRKESSRLLGVLALKTESFRLVVTNQARETLILLAKSPSRYLSRKMDAGRRFPAEKPTTVTSPQKTSSQLQATSAPEPSRQTENKQPGTPQASAIVEPSFFRHTPTLFSLVWEALRLQTISITRLLRTFSSIAFTKTRDAVSTTLVYLRSFFLRFPTKGRVVLVLAGFTVFGTFLWNTLPPKTQSVSPEETPSVSDTTARPSDSVRKQETTTTDLPPFRVLLRHPDTIASAYVNDNPVIVTRATVEIPSKQVSLSFPDGSGIPRTITPMQDLGLLFLLTDTGSLMTVSPASKTFAPNTLPETPSLTVRIAAYLTYLYTFSADGTILTRFPRVPGGFGEGTIWLKQDLSSDQNASFALNENVFIFSRSTLTRYSRGKADLTFDTPNILPDRLILAVEPENPLLVGLDSKNRRLITWNATNGHIESQYFSDSLENATSLSLHGRTVLISTPTETSESTLP